MGTIPRQSARGRGPRFHVAARPERHAALRCAGVTMIELVIVIMIMGVFAAVAVPSFVDSLQFHRVESAARRVKADLAQLRQSARLTSQLQTMTFAGTTYSVTGGAMRDLRQAGGSSYTVDLSAAPYDVASVTADFDDSPIISFNAFGSPSSGGQVELRNGAYQCVVTLDADTGQLSILRNYPGGRTSQP